MPLHDYPALAEQAIVALLEHEGACTWAEVHAKVADQVHPSVPVTIDPHHLTTARQTLLASGRIAVSANVTHGRRSIEVLHLHPVGRRRTAVDRAAARKRSLTSSFQAWATATTEHPSGLIGPAGELAVHRALQASASSGLTLINPQTGTVSALFGRPVPGGPLDNGAYALGLDPASVPRPPILIPIEVKNVRHWLYPHESEIYQLLYKAASLGAHAPDQPIAPLLVCRARSRTLNLMSRALGFRVVNTRKQYLLVNSTVKRHILEAVRTELGYVDLVDLASEPDEGLANVFRLLPREAQTIAPIWAQVGSHFAALYRDLRSPSLSPSRRATLLASLRTDSRALPGAPQIVW